MPTAPETIEKSQADTPAEPPAKATEAAPEPAPSQVPESPAQTPAVRPYDFRRPQHLSADQMRCIQRIHISAAELIQNRLARELGLTLDVHLKAVEELAFALVIEAMPEHTHVNVLDLTPLEEKGLLMADARLCLGLVDRTLGGRGQSPDTPRTLTAIDRAALERPMETVLQCLRQAWQEVCPLKLAVAGRRSDRQQAHVLPLGEPVLSATLEMQGELTSGTIRLCLPMAGLKGALDGASQRAGAARASSQPPASIHGALRAALERVPLTLTALVGTVELPVRSLLALRPGDIVRLDQPADKPVQIRVGGRPALLGRMGLSGRRKAVQILKRVDPIEEE